MPSHTFPVSVQSVSISGHAEAVVVALAKEMQQQKRLVADPVGVAPQSVESSFANLH